MKTKFWFPSLAVQKLFIALFLSCITSIANAQYCDCNVNTNTCYCPCDADMASRAKSFYGYNCPVGGYKQVPYNYTDKDLLNACGCTPISATGNSSSSN